jgi:hypothetical protein
MESLRFESGQKFNKESKQRESMSNGCKVSSALIFSKNTKVRARWAES